MAQETNIVAEPRTVHGSSAARRLRRSGLVPAVLATTGGETELLQLNAHDFEREVARHSNPQFIAHIACGGSVRTALVRELQRNGITGRIEHADFGEIDPARKLHVHIQLQLLGDPVGVRAENGVLEQHVRSIVVSCLPKDAIETLPVDVSELHKGDDIKVKDLALDAESAKIKGYESPVTGKTDILVVPSMSAGNIMVKALIEFAGAKMAGVVIGAKCPIALNSRSASFEEKYNSLLVCALMSGGKGAKA